MTVLIRCLEQTEVTEAFSRALVLYQHLAKPQTRTSVVVLTRGHVAFVFCLSFSFILVYESALFKARAHTEMPVLVLFCLFYLIFEENGPCPVEATVYRSSPEFNNTSQRSGAGLGSALPRL